MRVAIVHYHLRPGGVTRVIEHTLKALAGQPDAPSVCVLTGEPPREEGWEAVLGIHPSLAYGAVASSGLQTIADEITAEAERLLGGAPDLWHVHNHALGKNAVVPLLVRHLAERGVPLLLQPHDFAEDGRPGNYSYLREHLGAGGGPPLENVLYPVAPHVHWAPLNQRDASALEGSGVPSEVIHPLPNAVPAPPSPAEVAPLRPVGERRLVYPTRAIRRKNLGEFLLWAALDPTGNRYGVTLAPQNPQARPVYDRWVAFAEELNLPVDFEVGAGRPFTEVVDEADAMVTTSVAEGFGLAFLEPWLRGKELLGRSLPEITGEFSEAGLDLSRLYPRLPVPLDWVDGGLLRQALLDGLKTSYERYHMPLPDQAGERLWAGAVQDDGVDFGRLDEPLQEKVIRQVTDKGGPGLPLAPLCPAPEAERPVTITANAVTVRERYGLAAYGERLHGMYRDLLASGQGPLDAIRPNAMLKAYLNPERFCLLRT